LAIRNNFKFIHFYYPNFFNNIEYILIFIHIIDPFYDEYVISRRRIAFTGLKHPLKTQRALKYSQRSRVDAKIKDIVLATTNKFR
jgi:hypothetical protein